MTSINNWHQNS